jgi:hypothetical protein
MADNRNCLVPEGQQRLWGWKRVGRQALADGCVFTTVFKESGIDSLQHPKH